MFEMTLFGFRLNKKQYCMVFFELKIFQFLSTTYFDVFEFLGQASECYPPFLGAP